MALVITLLQAACLKPSSFDHRIGEKRSTYRFWERACVNLKCSCPCSCSLELTLFGACKRYYCKSNNLLEAVLTVRDGIRHGIQSCGGWKCPHMSPLPQSQTNELKPQRLPSPAPSTRKDFPIPVPAQVITLKN